MKIFLTKLVVLLIFCFAVLGFVSYEATYAQLEEAYCFVFLADGAISSEFLATFNECTEYVYEFTENGQSDPSSDGFEYGQWDNYLVAVDIDGEVYFCPSTQSFGECDATFASTPWSYWGNISFAFDDGSSSDDTTRQDSDSDDCYHYLPDGGVSAAFDDNFQNCAVFVYFQMNRGFQTEAYGQWGTYLFWVNANRDVYYCPSTQTVGQCDASLGDLAWVYWGDLSFLELTLDEVVDLGTLDVNDYWEDVFMSNDLIYRQPQVVYFNPLEESVRSACGAEPVTSPNYCSADHSIYLTEDFLASFFTEIGDYSAVLVIAHEWGHAMQAELGILGTRYSIQIELQADCLAGAYSAYAATQSENVVLEFGDIDEAATSLFLIGDDLPWFDPQAHGSGEQRMAAFYDGLENGLATCWVYAEQ